MKIDRIRVSHIKVPLAKPYPLSKVIGTLLDTEPIVIQIFTDEGITGLGEADPMIPFTEETTEGVKTTLKHYLGPALIGADPTNITKIHEIMDVMLKHNTLAKASVDMACYDILGKQAGLPVYEILGGCARTEITIGGGTGAGTNPEDTAKEVLAKIRTGTNTFMIKVGSLSVEEDIARIRAVREVAPQIHLIADANQGWDRHDAILFGKHVEDCNLEFLEQPVPYWDIEGLKEIRQCVKIPISVDETLCTIHDAVRVIKEGAAEVFSVKVSKNGGIYRAREIMDLAKAFGINCWMNSMIEEGITQAASLQLGVYARNILDYGHSYGSPLRLEQDITTYSDQIKGNTVSISQKPGLGIELKDDIMSKYAVEDFEIKA